MSGTIRSGVASDGGSSDDEAQFSDAGSTAPWTSRDTDKVRAQADVLSAAKTHMVAQMQAEQAAEQYSSDEGTTSRSSGEGVRRKDRIERAMAMEELSEVAERVSRVSAMRMTSRYRKGRVARGGDRMGDEVRQRVFGLEGSEVLVDLEQAGGLYAKLMCGEVVMMQYIARTGIGKTTKFASMVSKRCAMRVLLLEPDVLLAGAAAGAQRDKTRVRTAWSRSRVEQLTTMTYADFCGQFQSKNGSMMLNQFDVIIMDEAHVPRAEVYVAKTLVATFGNGRVSLLVLSATLGGEDSQTINNSTLPKELEGVLVDVVEAGKLTSGSRCKDRTMLILPTDEEAERCHRYITECGHISYCLDSASRTVDCDTVRQKMGVQSAVKRFLVVTEQYGTGHNFPVSQVYTDTTRKVYRMDVETRKVEAQVVPVTLSEMKQHVARVGRGMAQGATSYYFVGRGQPVPDVELEASERTKAYLLLRAAGVQPLTVLKPPTGFFPFGVTPSVASEILALGLPCEVAVRYFNSDGRMAANFVRAVRPFANLQHSFVASPLAAPIGFDKWEEVAVGGYYGCAKHSGVTVKVPFDVQDDELRVKMQAISAAALGSLVVPDWMPQLSESETSGDESSVLGTRPGRFLPRLVSHDTRPPTPPPKQDPWGFDAELEGQLGYRSSREGVFADAYTQATLDFLQGLDRDKVVEVPVVDKDEIIDGRGVERVNVLSFGAAGAPKWVSSTPHFRQVRPGVYESFIQEVPSPVNVQTPGGTVVVSLRKDVWGSMCAGEALSPDRMHSLLRAIKDNIMGFAQSNAFANWSNVWLSILRSCADENVLAFIQHKGSIHVVAALLQAMYVRYRKGVSNVVGASYVKSKFWKRITRGRSVEEQLKQDKAKGKVEIIQSESFFRRLADIRACTAKALVRLEEFGVYSPQTTTDLQHVLPVTAMVGDDMIDSVTDATRGAVRKRTGKIRAPESIGSGMSTRRSSFGFGRK